MFPVTARFLDAVQNSHTKQSMARHTNLITGVQTAFEIEDGSVTDDATSNVRGTASLTLPNEQATWDALDTVGGELAISQAVVYVDGTPEWVPMGVFIVDVDELGYGPGGTISINAAPNRWGKVQKSKLPPTGRASVRSNMAWQEIKRLVEGAWSVQYPFPGWSQLDQSATTKVGSILWDDGEREAAILDLCRTNSVEVFFDRTGKGVLRPVPVLSTTSIPVVTIAAGSDTAVLLDADRTRDRTRIANVLIVSTTAADVVFNPVEVANTTAGDPLSIYGTLGYAAQDFTSPAFRNSDQARRAGLTQLSKTLGAAKQLTLEAVGNQALDSDDVIQVKLPQIDRDMPRPVELHIIDSVTHPLAPSGTQSIATRSTRPDTDGS